MRFLCNWVAERRTTNERSHEKPFLSLPPSEVQLAPGRWCWWSRQSLGADDNPAKWTEITVTRQHKLLRASQQHAEPAAASDSRQGEGSRKATQPSKTDVQLGARPHERGRK